MRNAQRTKDDDHYFEPGDFFPYLVMNADGSDREPASREMTTEQSVRYLKNGFGLYVPEKYKARVGLT